MSIATDLTALGQRLRAGVTDKKGVVKIDVVVAERKAFLSRKKLIYTIKCRPDEAAMELNYAEMLKESGFAALSDEDDSEAGFGFSAGTYKSGFGKAAKRTIDDQVVEFGKQYTNGFDIASIRTQVEDIARKNGYTPKYHAVMF